MKWYDGYFFGMVGFGLMVMFIAIGVGACSYLSGK